jgi:ferredoxin
MVVIVKVQDNTWTEIGSFQAEDEKSLGEMAAMHWIEILQSCRAGFCWVCVCEVVDGWEAVDTDKVGNSGIDIQRDENWNPEQVLACVGGIKSEMFTDDKEHIVTLKKMY